MRNLIFLCLLTYGTATENYAVKLALIQKLLPHVEWGAAATFRHDEATPFCFGIFSDAQVFGDPLNKIREDATFYNHKVVVKMAENFDELKAIAPDLLFIPKEFSTHTAQIATFYAAKPVLLIGEEKGFVKKGGMISFYIEDGHMNFEYDAANLKQAGLAIEQSFLDNL